MSIDPTAVVHLKNDLSRPGVFLSVDGQTEQERNDPLTYSAVFDTFGTLPELEKVLSNSMSACIAFAKEWARCYPEFPRGAIMVTFSGFTNLERHTPTLNKVGASYVWMPETRLFPFFKTHFHWTLSCYVPGESVLIFLNTHTESRDRSEYMGRVFVANTEVCAPLFATCPTCLSLNPCDKWCARCMWVPYCSRKDQVAHYAPTHKTACAHYATLTGHTKHPIRALSLAARSNAHSFGFYDDDTA
jgi:hypothetical protein